MTSSIIFAQDKTLPKAVNRSILGKCSVWWWLRFECFGSGYTDISIAPSAIYNFNEYFATGVGLARQLSSKYENDRDMTVIIPICIWR